MLQLPEKRAFFEELPWIFKDSVSVSTTSMPMIDGSEEIVKVPYIHYPVQFKKGQEQIRVLLNSNSEINAISLAFTQKLGFYIQKTNVRAQKINSSMFETFGMVIADFQVENKGVRPRFFQKIFLVADTKFKVILRMLFLKISNANVAFGEGTLM